MSESNKNSMLLPLGLGAAGLLLYMAMKKKQASVPEAAVAPESAALLPGDVPDAAMPQIDPPTAPSYTQAVAQTASSEEGEDESGEQEEQDDERSDNEGQEEESDYAPASSSGSSYAPYMPTSTINTDKPRTVPIRQVRNTRRTPVRMVGNGKSAMRADALLRKQQQMNLQKKAMRFQSGQGKLLKQQKIVGNGKPAMTAIAPFPVATAIAKTITKNNMATVTQSTIFPLKFGMTNNPYVRELQRRIGVSATGHFNSQTRNALHKKYRVKEVSEPLYKQIITGKAPVVAKPKPKLLNKMKNILPKRKAKK